MQMEQAHSGFLLAGLAGPGKPGYLFVPYAAVGPGPSAAIDPYVFGHAQGERAIWLPNPELEFLDQPLRYVSNVLQTALDEGREVVIAEVRYPKPGFFRSQLRLEAEGLTGELKVVVNAYASPPGLRGVEEGTLVEVYRHWDEVDHRPWATRYELVTDLAQ